MIRFYYLLVTLLGLATPLVAQTIDPPVGRSAEPSGAARPSAAGDEHWLPGFEVGAPDGRVSVVVTAPNGDVYIGGAFHYVGDVAAANIARWDGTRWYPLGAELLSSPPLFEILGETDLGVADGLVDV